MHIYRLVCSSTVEENILKKARQKRRIDYLVMTEGNFSEESLFSTNGLRDIFGAEEDGALGEWEGSDSGRVGGSASGRNSPALSQSSKEGGKTGRSPAGSDRELS